MREDSIAIRTRGLTRYFGRRAGLAVVVTFSLFAVMVFVWATIEMQRVRRTQANAPVVNEQCMVQLGPDGRPWLTQLRYSDVAYEYEPMRGARMVPGRSVKDDLQPLSDGWEPLRQWTPNELTNCRPVLGRRFIELRRASVFQGSSEVNRAWVFDAKGDAVLVYRRGVAGMRFQYRREKTLRPPGAVGSFGELRNVSDDDPFGGFTFVTTTGVFHAPNSGEGNQTVFAMPPSAKFVGSAIHTASKSEPHWFGLMVRLDDRAIVVEGTLEPNGKSESGPRDLSSRLDQLSMTETRLPKPLTDATLITLARDPVTDGHFIGLVQDVADSEKGVRWFHFDQDGHILEQQQFEGDSQAPSSHLNLAAAFVPPSAWAVATAIAVVESRKGIGLQRFWVAVKRKPAEAVRAFSSLSIQPWLGMVLAIWAARRRKLAKRQTCWWVLWAFFFGPCGGLALLAVYPRILRQPCPNCRQAARVDLECCERCGHSLDDIPAAGIELFDRDLRVGPELVATSAP